MPPSLPRDSDQTTLSQFCMGEGNSESVSEDLTASLPVPGLVVTVTVAGDESLVVERLLATFEVEQELAAF